AFVASAVGVWGGARAVTGRDDRVQAGAQVRLELREVSLALDRKITLGHDRAATVRVPGAGAATIAELAADPHGVRVHTSCPDSSYVVPTGGSLVVQDCGATSRAFTIRGEPGRVAIGF